LLNYAPEPWRDYVQKLAQVNWQESDPIWATIRSTKEQIDPKTNQSVTTYKKQSGYSSVATAIESVRKAIGWCRPDPLVTSSQAASLQDDVQGLDVEAESPEPLVLQPDASSTVEIQ
jgi:hypothetical protein